MSFARLLLFASFAVFGASAATLNATRRQNCDAWTIDGTSGFTERVHLDFSQYGPSDNAGQVLDSHGFYVSGYLVPESPSNPHDVGRIFRTENVYFGDGFLNLRVKAYSGINPWVESAEIGTINTQKYGSAHVVWQSSSTPGVCEGSFFYQSDSQETDIEILTSTIDTPSAQVPAGWWATNQALSGGADKTTQVVPFTFDPRSSFHEYRLDWVEGSTTFIVDGVQKVRHTTNIPTEPAPYIFNAWSNGDPTWSAGPPKKDSITRIRSIDLYRGWVAQVSGNVCQM